MFFEKYAWPILLRVMERGTVNPFTFRLTLWPDLNIKRLSDRKIDRDVQRIQDTKAILVPFVSPFWGI